MFSRSFLLNLKVKALRRRVWLKLLLEERSIIELTIKTVKVVKSKILRSVLLRIVLKILDLLEDKLMNIVYNFGYKIAHKYSSYALRWGNQKAREWVKDEAYIFYLGLSYMNTPPIYRVKY